MEQAGQSSPKNGRRSSRPGRGGGSAPLANALAGFLHHHNIPGFLTNQTDITTIDENRWRAFLTTWHDRHKEKPLTAADLRKDAEPTRIGQDDHDPWDGTFITTHSGRLPNTLALGRLLTGQLGRWRGDYVIRTNRNERGDRAMYWVEHHQQ